MQFAPIDGTLLHYQVIGAPEGKPTLVFANSLGTDFRIWRDVIVRLVGEVAIVTYDKRGHGLSDVPPAPYTMGDHVADLAGLLDHLGAEPAVIVGLSVGGMIAQALAVERPDLVRGLVLLCTAARFADRAFWQDRIETVEREGMESYSHAIVDRWFSDAFKERAGADLPGYRNMVARTPLAGYAGTCAALRDADHSALVRDIDVPSICIAGERDVAAPPEQMMALARSIRDCRYEQVPGCGHIPCVEQPEYLVEIIRAFLSDAQIA